ncbi:MAG: hypothetical protein ACXVBB_04990 [Isosphaeraceae bacterium]
MLAHGELSIPIGHDAYARAGARHTLGIWRPSVCPPMQPFARLRYQPEGGEPLEIVVWLPGPHPETAAWWQDLGLWIVVQTAKMETVRR